MSENSVTEYQLVLGWNIYNDKWQDKFILVQSQMKHVSNQFLVSVNYTNLPSYFTALLRAGEKNKDNLGLDKMSA